VSAADVIMRVQALADVFRAAGDRPVVETNAEIGALIEMALAGAATPMRVKATCPTCSRLVGTSKYGRVAHHYRADSLRWPPCPGTGEFGVEFATPEPKRAAS
jgi:hypothetical protein